MKKKLIKKSILLFVIVITSFFLLYRFMTYDRTYTWAKEFPYDIEKIATSQNLKIEKSEPINIEKIKLPIERK
ncbi:MAG TPA: hypothetical protein VKY32_09205, partial [Flavobacterium sp.]|nr:hypothetical protein [Flavobacterium sp.]